MESESGGGIGCIWNDGFRASTEGGLKVTAFRNVVITQTRNGTNPFSNRITSCDERWIQVNEDAERTAKASLLAKKVTRTVCRSVRRII